MNIHASLRLAVSAALAIGASSAQALSYTVRDLGGLPGGYYSYAYDINQAGAIVGTAFDAQTDLKPVLFGANGPVDLGVLPGSSSAMAINDKGQVLVNSMGSGQNKGYLYSGGTLTDLGMLSGGSASHASALNNAGQVAGYTYFGSTYKQRATLYSNGTLTDLGTLPTGTESYAADINSQGQVVGRSDVYEGYGYRAFLYSNGTMTDLGTLAGYTSSAAVAINDLGVVTGTSDIYGSQTRAFISSAAGLVSLGTLGGDFSYAGDINNLDQIVGISDNADGNSRPFLYTDGQMLDLNALLDPAQSGGVFLEYADAINDQGQIVGSGLFNGQRHAFLLTPTAVPEPAAWALLLAGVACVGLKRRVRAQPQA